MHFTYKQKLFNEYHTKVEIVIKNFYMNLSKKKNYLLRELRNYVRAGFKNQKYTKYFGFCNENFFFLLFRIFLFASHYNN